MVDLDLIKRQSLPLSGLSSTHRKHKCLPNPLKAPWGSGHLELWVSHNLSCNYNILSCPAMVVPLLPCRPWSPESALTCGLSLLLTDCGCAFRAIPGPGRHTHGCCGMQQAHSVCIVVFLGCHSGPHTGDVGLDRHTHFMMPFSMAGQLCCCRILRVFCKGRKEKIIL